MKNTKRFAISLLAVISIALTGPDVVKASTSSFRTIDPIVSTDWLSANGNLDNLVILDVRNANDYNEGHIPEAINEPFVVPFSAWITMRDDLLLEVPDATDLFGSIGALGIETTSQVVIVSAPNPGEPPFYGLSNATRVADTLIYAGVPSVAILDGGYPKWVAEGLPITMELPNVTPVVFDGIVNEEMFVSTTYVRSNLRKATLIDARDADVYFGATVEFFAEKAGHIQGATSLPAPWIWDADDGDIYTYKDSELLRQMAAGAMRAPYCGCRQGGHGCKEIIVYCGVGGYASSWWYVLTQVLGYQNVSFYDGSAQDWVRYYNMVPFQWQ